MKADADLTGRERRIEWLRWIGVVPAALLGSGVGHAIMVGVFALLAFTELSHEGLGRWLRHVVGGLPGGAAFVIAGAVTAPRCRLATAIVLAILSIALSVAIHWVHHRDAIPVVAKTVAVACGVAVVVALERRNAGERDGISGWRRRPSRPIRKGTGPETPP